MVTIAVKARNTMFRLLYQFILKPLFFMLDPEDVHDHMTQMGSLLGRYSVGKKIMHYMYGYSHESLEQNICGITFKNPIGLAAGFDKDGHLMDILPEIGFGFEEMGSVTAQRCAGNPKPRLQRLKKSKSLVVYYGLKNDGALAIHKRLGDRKFKFPLGISIAKTNCKETADMQTGVQDYRESYMLLHKQADYVTLNISCPNAYGGQPFTDKVSLRSLLTSIQEVRGSEPIFIKLSPDLTETQIDDIVELGNEFNIDGYICTNLTKNRDNKKIIDPITIPGGVSGKVVQSLSDDLIRKMYIKTQGKKVIMGCGGVSNAADAYRKITNGASLIQMITGMIFEGPQAISDINLGLVELLRKDGYTHISQAVGKDIES